LSYCPPEVGPKDSAGPLAFTLRGAGPRAVQVGTWMMVRTASRGPDGDRRVVVTASTAPDGAGNDATVSRDYTVVRHQPDGHVRRSNETAFLGDDVINLTGVGQTRNTGVGRSGTATFVFRVQNDGSVSDRVTVHGQRTAGRFRVQWFRGTTDVTAAVNAGTLTLGIAPGASTNLRLVVTARANAVRGAAVTATLTLRSEALGTAADVVRAKVVRP